MDVLMACMAITVLYPKLLIYSMGVGALLGYTITHWRPDPAKSLLLKIVDQLDENGEQQLTCVQGLVVAALRTAPTIHWT